jgi:hypothetical protein
MKAAGGVEVNSKLFSAGERIRLTLGAKSDAITILPGAEEINDFCPG